MHFSTVFYIKFKLGKPLNEKFRREGFGHFFCILRAFQQALGERCEINIFIVIIKKPSFGDATQEWLLPIIFWGKMVQTFFAS